MSFSLPKEWCNQCYDKAKSHISHLIFYETSAFHRLNLTLYLTSTQILSKVSTNSSKSLSSAFHRLNLYLTSTQSLYLQHLIAQSHSLSKSLSNSSSRNETSASHSISHGTAKSHLTAQSLYLQHFIVSISLSI